MATNLYEILEVERTATPEEIRRAYKKRALKVHPDRLRPDATAQEKATSAEEFRKVNNAYEILNDSKSRREYDRHGIWPPPEQQPAQPRRSSSDHRRPRRDMPTDPFFDPQFQSSFMFHDPFELFNSIFGDMVAAQMNDRHHRSMFSNPIFDDYPGSRHRQRSTTRVPTFDDLFAPQLMAGMLPMSSSSTGQWGQWGGLRSTSESVMTQTINGVTHTVHQRRDADGNEFISRTYPDGRVVKTVNGVEQPQAPSQLPPPPPRGYIPPDVHSSQEYISPPPPYRQRRDSPKVLVPEIETSRSHRKRHQSTSTPGYTNYYNDQSSSKPPTNYRYSPDSADVNNFHDDRYHEHPKSRWQKWWHHHL